MKTTAPTVKKVPHEITTDGHTRVDNYYWLNQKDNPEVIAYLKSENEFTDKTLAPYKEMQEKLYEEIKGRIVQNQTSQPYFSNGFWYQTKYEEGKEYPIYVRLTAESGGDEKVLFDVNKMAEGKPHYNFVAFDISPNNELAAYAYDLTGGREYIMEVKDLNYDKIYDFQLQNINSFVWGNDNETIYYCVSDKITLRTYKFYSYNIRTGEKNELFEEKDELFDIIVAKTLTQRYIILHIGSTLTSEVHYIDLESDDKSLKLFAKRRKKHEYAVDQVGDYFYIMTNRDDSPNNKVMRAPLNNTQEDAWEEFIEYRPDVYITDITLFRNHIVLDTTVKGLNYFEVIRLDNKESHTIEQKEPAYYVYSDDNEDLDRPYFRYYYTSFSTPTTVIDYYFDSKKTEVKKTYGINDPSFNSENYIVERQWVEARDGVKVPISMIRHKNTKPSSETPLLLYAYGSYGYDMPVTFSSSRLSYIDRGFIYVIAHIRGGGEMGRQWYEDGKFLKKKNTFYDFIDCAKYLIANNYTSPKHLYIKGGSAGGLLMGAVTNMAPELFNGVIANVPFVDVVTTMLDESIPLTVGEFEEWGNPKDKEYYDYMLSYSPYDNVEAKDYPNIFVSTGFYDSQVQYFEPTKWVAKLRDMKTDDNLLLYHINMDSGHSGASGRFSALKEVSMEYTFMFALENISF